MSELEELAVSHSARVIGSGTTKMRHDDERTCNPAKKSPDRCDDVAHTLIDVNNER